MSEDAPIDRSSRIAAGQRWPACISPPPLPRRSMHVLESCFAGLLSALCCKASMVYACKHHSQTHGHSTACREAGAGLPGIMHAPSAGLQRPPGAAPPHARPPSQEPPCCAWMFLGLDRCRWGCEVGDQFVKGCWKQLQGACARAGHSPLPTRSPGRRRAQRGPPARSACVLVKCKVRKDGRVGPRAEPKPASQCGGQRRASTRSLLRLNGLPLLRQSALLKAQLRAGRSGA